MILDLFRLNGKVAVVTGAGRGIGAASASPSRVRADVVISSRTQSDLDRVAELVTAPVAGSSLWRGPLGSRRDAPTG